MPALLYLIAGMLALATASAQKPVSTPQQELQRLRQSIESTRQRIKSLEQRESKALRSLSATQRQQKNINKMVASLSRTLAVLVDSLHTIETKFSQTKASISNTDDRWRLLTRGMYEHLVINRGRQRQSHLPSYLYTQATLSAVRYRSALSDTADSLSNQLAYLGDVSQSQAVALRQQQQKNAQLSLALSRQSKEIQSVRNSKQELLEELRKKQQSATKIRSMIEQLVAKERKQQSTSTKKNAKASKPPAKGGKQQKHESTVATNAPKRGSFQSKSLPWPTPSQSILHSYGTYTNSATGTTHENPGIDIKASVGTGVSCVAKGLVSTVTWLPGFGSLVIIDHQNGFRTVYANLSRVSVQRGSSVGQGSRIGSSGSNLDGNLVHFEIWIDGKRINPLTYLR
ncbi:MAG: hypothetical protein FJ211_02635 [Ignavibacteria bacterium]|nr:hypothetical protein [Ignavibacteria bacterium]